tara:strand:+ start:120 stop:716 length:597 start_codon:yes stop_codon:yes gene_type:complete
MKLKDLKNLIYEQNHTASAKDRRESLTSKMFELSSQGKDCFSCNGMCCTFEFNSMQSTPLETVEVCLALARDNRLNEELIQKLEECVKEFRLEKDISMGKGKSFRRTYTCPFFKEGAKGCSISLHDKPYGCLGFNPKELGVSTEGHCGVYVDSHLQREEKYLEQENKINKILISELGLYWEKLPIPLAILDLTKRLGE